jgi:hypothetical protein
VELHKDFHGALRTEGRRYVTIEGNTVVNRPIEAIFDCVASEKFMQQMISPSWLQKNALTPASQLRQLSEGAMGVGTKFRLHGGASGPPGEVPIEIVAYQRPTTFAFEVMRGLNVTTIKWSFQSTAAGTRVTLKVRTRRETGWGRVLRPMLVLLAPRGRGDEQRLRQYLEERCEP